MRASELNESLQASRAEPQTTHTSSTADLFRDTAQSMGISVAELELRLMAAEQVLMGLAVEKPDSVLSEAYRALVHRLDSSCGATSEMLGDLFFSGAPTRAGKGMGVLRDALMAPGDAVLRVNMGFHSIFIEKHSQNIYILQSYFGQQSLANSIDYNLMLSASDFIVKLDEVIASYDGSVHHNELELFGGRAFRSDVVANDSINVEISTDIASPQVRRQRIGDLLAREHAAWTQVMGSDKTLSSWLDDYLSAQNQPSSEVDPPTHDQPVDLTRNAWSDDAFDTVTEATASIEPPSGELNTTNPGRDQIPHRTTPTPNIKRDEYGIDWASPHRSTHDANGNPIPEDKQFCVSIAVIEVISPIFTRDSRVRNG